MMNSRFKSRAYPVAAFFLATLGMSSLAHGQDTVILGPVSPVAPVPTVPFEPSVSPIGTQPAPLSNIQPYCGPGFSVAAGGAGCVQTGQVGNPAVVTETYVTPDTYVTPETSYSVQTVTPAQPPLSPLQPAPVVTVAPPPVTALPPSPPIATLPPPPPAPAILPPPPVVAGPGLAATGLSNIGLLAAGVGALTFAGIVAVIASDDDDNSITSTTASN